VDYLPPRLDDQKRVRRDFLRQAWQLAGRLADHLRNYEYHRPALIEAWRRGSAAFYDSSGKDLEPLLRMEAAQRALYNGVLGPGGLRDGFTRREGALLTLGEYARRVFTGARPGTSGSAPLPPFHVFALSEPSALHADLLHRLAEVVPVHLYLLTPRAAGVDSVPALLARVTRAAESSGPASVAELTRLWGEADARLVRRLGPLLMDRGRFTFEVLADEVATTQAKRMTPASPRTQRSVLTAVQDGLVRREPGRPRRQRQDASLQIVGCPSIQRELETVHEGILHNLRADPSLGPTDFAVLVPDLARYRAALAAAGVDRLTAAKWVHWAHALNICHAFDRSDKRARGYPDNGLYTWQQALQRLRLGRVLDCGGGQAEDSDLPDYQGIVPYCDLDSGDADVLGRFCWTVETLYRRLQRLKDLSATAGRWRDEIRGVLAELLAVPEDRPEEQEVRNGLFAYLDRWADVGPW
jgi:exonuclease V gamma subunit